MVSRTCTVSRAADPGFAAVGPGRPASASSAPGCLRESVHSAKAPLISVVTPSFNQGRFLERCIRSVLDQNYPHFEHIVADNCSTDETLAVLRRFPHVQGVSEPDRGQADALNKAIRRSRGEIIAWINADDFYEPGAFDLAARELASHTGVMAIAGGVHKVDEAGAILETFVARFEGLEGLIPFWAGGYGLCQPGVFFRREVFDALGGFRTDLHYAMDYDFWLRLAERWPIRTVERVLARYVVHAASKTGRSRFGDGFSEELEAVSRRYWGRRGSARRRGFARGCAVFSANRLLSAFVSAHRHERRIDWRVLRRLVARRPTALLHRYVIAVFAERGLGRRAWSAARRMVGFGA